MDDFQEISGQKRQSGVNKYVHIHDPDLNAHLLQSVIFTSEPRRPRPNVVVLNASDMSMMMETDAYGFRGPETDFSNKLVAVWGDSWVEGIAIENGGWVTMASEFCPGFQFLNGGVSGDVYENILERAIETNKKVHLDHNVFSLGWHSRGKLQKEYEILHQAIDNLPGCVLCTLPTSLSEKIVNIDLSSYFIGLDEVTTGPLHDEAYVFFGNMPYTTDNAKKLFGEIKERNDITRKVANEGKVPLLDFYHHFYNDNIETFRNDFFDAPHPRPKSYIKFAKFLSQCL